MFACTRWKMTEIEQLATLLKCEPTFEAVLVATKALTDDNDDVGRSFEFNGESAFVVGTPKSMEVFQKMKRATEQASTWKNHRGQWTTIYGTYEAILDLNVRLDTSS